MKALLVMPIRWRGDVILLLGDGHNELVVHNGQSASCALPRSLCHESIHHHQGRHGFHNGHRSWNHTGIVSALGFEHALLLVVCGSLLSLTNRGRRLEADGEEDGHAVADAALNATRVVGLGCQPRPGANGLRCSGHRRSHGGSLDERIVVYRAWHLATAKPRANLEAFRGRNTQHCMRQFGLDGG